MENLRNIDKGILKDRIEAGVSSALVGGFMGIPTSGLLVGYIGEIINNAVGSPLGEWGGWKVGFAISEVAHMAAFYPHFREQQRQFDSRRWQLPYS